jgi:hypothetical protein
MVTDRSQKSSTTACGNGAASDAARHELQTASAASLRARRGRFQAEHLQEEAAAAGGDL